MNNEIIITEERLSEVSGGRTWGRIKDRAELKPVNIDSFNACCPHDNNKLKHELSGESIRGYDVFSCPECGMLYAHYWRYGDIWYYYEEQERDY